MKRPFLATLLLTAMPLLAQRPDLRHTWSSPMRLYVVLVKFQDVNTKAGADKYKRHKNDTPHGWSKNSRGEWVPGDDAYTLEDFQKLFGESGAPSFKGTGITVADDEDLPEVFGSVKDYFDEVSGGDLELQVEVVNDPMDGHEDYPEWIELPRPRWYYERYLSEYWEHAYTAAVAAGHTDLPDGNTIANRKANKILFLHAGAEIADYRGLHPKVEQTTTGDPLSTDVSQYGYRYVVAERRSIANPGHHELDAFSDIGIHVHEIGHLLGFSHYGPGHPAVPNPYTGQDATGSGDIKYHGNWSIMSSNQHGPPVWKEKDTTTDYTAFVTPYGSCPVVFDVVYRKMLGWDDGEVLITETVQDRTIDPGPSNYYRIRSLDHPYVPSEFFLDLREAKGFGEYIGWHRFEKMVGVFVWKEVLDEQFPDETIWDDPRLIPADGRWIRDARRSNNDRTPIDATLNKPDVKAGTHVYVWQDQISDPFGFLETNGLPSGVTFPKPNARPDVRNIDDSNHLLDAEDREDFPPARVAIRRIRMLPDADDAATGQAKVNIFINHWIGDIEPHAYRSETISEYSAEGDVYIGGDLTIKSGATFTIEEDAVVYFLEPETLDGNGNKRSDIIVADNGTLNIRKGVVFRSALETGRDAEADDEEHGLVIQSGGTVNMDGLTIAQGQHTFKGKAIASADISVGDPSAGDSDRPEATLIIDSSSEIEFKNNTDLEDVGNSPDLAEIVVQKGSTLEVKTATLRPQKVDPQDPGWYGIYNKGTVSLDSTTLQAGEYCYDSGDTDASITPTVAAFEDCGMFTGNRSVTVTEGEPMTATLGSYSAKPELSDAAFGSLVWTTEGDDSGDFVLSLSNGALTFNESPEYDDDGDNSYDVTVKATASKSGAVTATATQDVDIRVSEITDDTSGPGPGNIRFVKTSGSEGQVRASLGMDGSSKARMILYRVWSVTLEGKDKQWHRGSASQWVKKDVHFYAPSIYRIWQTNGALLKWPISKGRTYTFELEVGMCRAEQLTACNADRDEGYSSVNRDHYWMSPLASDSFTVPRSETLTIGGPDEPNIWHDDPVGHPLATYTAADESEDPVITGTWTLVEAPDGFSIDNNGQLLFTEDKPLFVEGGTNEYNLVVKVNTETETSDKYEVTLTLVRPTPGVLSFPGGDRTAAQGTDLTVTLTDPDNARDIRWTWHRKMLSGSLVQVHTELQPIVTKSATSTYTPTAQDVGQPLRISTSYRDDHTIHRRTHSPARSDGASANPIQTHLVTGTNTAGTVVFDPDPPVENKILTVELDDPNAVDFSDVGVSWTLSRVPTTGSETSVNLGGNSTSTRMELFYKPVADDVGSKLKWTASYTDFFGDQTATATTATVVNAPPPPPPPPTTNNPGEVGFTFAQTDPADVPQETKTVTATVTDDDGVSDVTWGDWVRVDGSTETSLMTTDATDGNATYTPVEADVGKELKVTATYDDDDGEQTATGTTGTVVAKPNAPGEVSFTFAQTDPADVPQETKTVTASVADDDGVSDVSWGDWVRVDGSTETSLTSTDGTDGNATYTPVAADVGKKLKVTATYDDDDGEQTATGTTGTVVVKPTTPGTNSPGEVSFTFEQTDPADVPQETKAVTAFVADDDGVSDVTWGDWVRVDGSTETTLTSADGTDGNATYTPVAADVGKKLKVTATYDDDDGEQTATGTTGTVVVKPTTPGTNSPGEVSFTFEQTDPADVPQETKAVTASVADDDGVSDVTWGDWVRVDGSTETTLTSADGTDGNATYTPVAADVDKKLKVTATYDDDDGEQTATGTTGIVVRKPNGPGVLGISPDPPVKGQTVTATLIDEDNHRQHTWRWDRVGASSSDENSARTTTPSLSATDTYTPTSGDVGSHLKVTVNYNDEYGNHTVRKTTNSPVIATDCVITVDEVPDTKQDVPENTTQSAGTYEVGANSYCGDLTWSPGGTDGSSFDLEAVAGHSDRRTLEFKSAPNYESKHIYSVKIQVSDGEVTGTANRTVRVTNEIETGSITFNSSAPRVCSSLQATLTDPDGGIDMSDDDHGWTWDGVELSETSATVTRSIPSSRVGQKISVIAEYEDNAAADNTLTVSTGTVLASVPMPPRNLSGSVGTKSMTWTWDAPSSDCGSAVARYQYRYRVNLSGGTWSPWTFKTARTATASGLLAGTEYKFEVRAVNAIGSGSSVTSTATIPANDEPEVSGRTQVSVPENTSKQFVGVYTVSDDDLPDDTITWSVSDGAIFSHSAGATDNTRRVTFAISPNYEAKKSYSLQVTATDASGASDSHTTAITIENVDEDGTVTLSNNAPKWGDSVTALLSDPDGDLGFEANWEWSTTSSSSSQGTALDDHDFALSSDGRTLTISSKYLVGKFLRASREYSDGHGDGKYASATTTSVVSAKKPLPPPNLNASRGDAKVTLTWDAADDQGANIDRYNYRFKVDGGSYTAYSRVTSRTKTIEGLTNGTLYYFQVRAHNPAGFGPPSTDSATPAGNPDAPSGFSYRRPITGSVRIEWDEPDDNGASITDYIWNRKVGQIWNNDTHTNGDRNFTATGILAGVTYTFRVKAKNSIGWGPYAEYTVPAHVGDSVTNEAGKVLVSMGGPDELAIYAAPNPFNPTTMFYYQLPEDGPVSLVVYNLSGQSVATLAADPDAPRGVYAKEWDGTSDGRAVAGGVYLWRLMAGGQVRVGKVALVR